MKPPKTLLFDIETAPSLGYVWGKWEQNVIEMEKDWYVLSFAYKWLGGSKVNVCALPDYEKSYSRNPEDDGDLVARLWELFNAADVIVGHNGDGFDVKKTNARFVVHGLRPPSPYKTVDTLKLARRHFKFDSNKLDDLARYFKVGSKLPHSGKHTWLGCMTGDKKAWATMRQYNAHDVVLLEAIYLRLRAWGTHPNLNSYTQTGVCPVCESAHLQKRGWNVTKTGRRLRLHCQDCGAWSSGIKHFRTIS